MVNKQMRDRHARYMFVLPGRLTALTHKHGEIGQATQLSSGNPILYLNFPMKKVPAADETSQGSASPSSSSMGRLKLFGTICYPSKGRYIIAQVDQKHRLPAVYTKSELDHVVVFSKAVWVGSQEDNPLEEPLPTPSFLLENPQPLHRRVSVVQSASEGDVECDG